MPNLDQSEEALSEAKRLRALDRVGEAIAILERLDAAGVASAAFNLSLIYRMGTQPPRSLSDLWRRATTAFVAPDWGKATDYCRRAAELGDTNAQCDLARFYFEGGNPLLEIDAAASYHWASLATDNPGMTPRSLEAMEILSELYAGVNSCPTDVYHAGLLRIFAWRLRELLLNSDPSYRPVPQTFEISTAAAKFADSAWLEFFPHFFDGERRPLARSDADWLQIYRRMHRIPSGLD